MKRKYKLLLSTIGLLSISTITIASVISCSDGSDNYTKTNNHSASSKNVSSSNSNNISPINYSALTIEQISNALTGYFSDTNNQMALVNYLLTNGYLTYSDRTWLINTSYTSWNAMLSAGMEAFVSNNPNISYDGILGTNITNISIFVTVTQIPSPVNNLSFYIVYDSNDKSSSIVISSQILNESVNNSTLIPNALTSYLNESKNQMSLLNYLFNTNYLTFYNDTLSSGSNYRNLYVALNEGLKNFISWQENNYYNKILNWNIVWQLIRVTNVSYSTSNGLAFTISYYIINATSDVTISTSTLNNYNEISNSPSNVSIANDLTSYFSNTNNQEELINWLLRNNYITYSNKIWNYNSNNYTSWASTLNAGMDTLITSNPVSFYDGVFGSSISTNNILINVNENITSSNTLVFTIIYNNVSASSNVTITAKTFSDYNENINVTNAPIVNALINYFNGANNQIALIAYLLNNNYIKYSNGIWSYDITSSNLNGNNLFTSLIEALNYGIRAFLSANSKISYDGILGSNINTYDLSITSASYSTSDGLVFTIAYNGISASNNITIAPTILNDSNLNINSTSISIINALTNYFSSTNNQVALINYLITNNYITYKNDIWNYNTISSYLNDNNSFGSWTNALSAGISAFISSNPNISYDGILCSSMNVGQYNESNGGYNTNDFSVKNASYSKSNGLVFTITYNGISASSDVTISSTILNYYNKNTNTSNILVSNALTSYFSNTNNQVALITYLINNNYITYSIEGWTFENNDYKSWDNTLSNGISAFISNNENISYDGILGSSINTDELSATNTLYSTSGGLVFSIAYNDISASNNLKISNITLSNNTNFKISNALTTYFSNENNQVALIKYLLNNGNIIQSNSTWNYNINSSPWEINNGNGYTSWASALSNGISAFIATSQDISYNGILGSNINIGYNGENNDLSIVSASYNTSDGLVFNIAYNGISASSNVTISDSTLNNYNDNANSSNIVIANDLNSYFSDTNNQVALISYLYNYYIVYSNNLWNYNTNNYSSWDSALTDGISDFISDNQNISYDGVLGSNIDILNVGGSYSGDFLISNASYSASSGLVFTFEYNNVSASSNVTISSATFNNPDININLANTIVANALTTYFNDTNNQIALITYLINNNCIKYSNGVWSYNKNSSSKIANNSQYFTSWNMALKSGINAFISNNPNISYDGILSKNISNSDVSIIDSEYSASGNLIFAIAYSNIDASSNVTISSTTLNKYYNSNLDTANALTTYFISTNNQVSLINYLLLNNYIIFSNDTWNYNSKEYSSWDISLTDGIKSFISKNQTIYYNTILGLNMNSTDIVVVNATYSTTNRLVFNISYNGISASGSIKLMSIETYFTTKFLV